MGKKKLKVWGRGEGGDLCCYFVASATSQQPGQSAEAAGFIIPALTEPRETEELREPPQDSRSLLQTGAEVDQQLRKSKSEIEMFLSQG